MDTNELMMQDFTDILRINTERAKAYNKSAYDCKNLQLKMSLHRELDNARDSALSTKRFLFERFEITSEPQRIGQVYSMWSDFKPSFEEVGMETQLLSYEMADQLTLQCYKVVLARPYLDSNAKNVLEFQYQNLLSLYKNIKRLRVLPLGSQRNFTSSYSYRKSA